MANAVGLLIRLLCRRCGYRWIPRVAHVKECPRCKNPNWNKPRKVKRA